MPQYNASIIESISRADSVLAATKGSMRIVAVSVLQETIGSVVGTQIGLKKRHKLAKEVIQMSYTQLPVLETAAAEIMRQLGSNYFNDTSDANQIAQDILNMQVQDSAGNQIGFWNYLAGVTRDEF